MGASAPESVFADADHLRGDICPDFLETQKIEHGKLIDGIAYARGGNIKTDGGIGRLIRQ